MRYLLTGSTGFIGRRLRTMLLERGETVDVIKRGDDIHGIMARVKPDVVIHLAAAYVRDHAALDVARLVQSNVEFGTHVLEAMRVCGVRNLVTMSSQWTLPAAVNLYAATKRAFDAIIDYYCRAYNRQAVTLLLGDTYGPEDRRGKIVYRLIEATITGEPIDLTPGEQVIDLVHVDDVCAAIIRSWQDPNMHQSEHWTMAVRGERVSLRALAALIEEVSGKRINARWGALPYHHHEVMTPWDSNYGDVHRWRPARSLRDWLRILVRQV